MGKRRGIGGRNCGFIGEFGESGKAERKREALDRMNGIYRMAAKTTPATRQ